MELEAELPGERSRLAHQVAGHREGRARRDRELDTRARLAPRAAPASRSVSSRMASIVLDERVGREAALRLAEIHRAARGDEADAELAGGLELRLDQPLLAVREDVVVVEDRPQPESASSASPVRAAAYSASASMRAQVG